MALHQYIGARYVPIFYQNSLDPTSTLWESNVTYEPMTWVSMLNGNMYLSKKTVPATAGDPASTPEYWMEAGQFNAYIQSLQDQIDDMNDGSVTGSLQNQIDEMKDGSVSGSLQQQITQNATDISNITHRRFIVITDSLGSYTNNDGKNMMELAQEYCGIANDDYFMIQHSGHGFYNDDYLNDLRAEFSNITDHDSITDVFCVVGFNDLPYVSSLTPYLTNFNTYVNNNYPKAKIHLCNEVWSPWRNATDASYFNLILTYQNFAMSHNWIYVANFNAYLHDSNNYLSDGVHPTQNGVDCLGYALAGAIINDDGFKARTTMAMTGSFITGNIYGNVTRQGVEMFTENTGVVLTVSIPTFNRNSFIDLGQLTRTFINTLDDHIPVNTVPGIVDDGTLHDERIAFYVKGGHFYVSVAGTGSYSNVTRIILYGFDLVFNTDIH